MPSSSSRYSIQNVSPKTFYSGMTALPFLGYGLTGSGAFFVAAAIGIAAYSLRKKPGMLEPDIV